MFHDFFPFYLFMIVGLDNSTSTSSDAYSYLQVAMIKTAIHANTVIVENMHGHPRDMFCKKSLFFLNSIYAHW